jgi:hypothetical protein
MRRCYIAGPMRGRDDFNRAAFLAAAERLTREGWQAITPFDLNAPDGSDEVAQLTNDGPSLQRLFAQRDLDCVLSLRPENGDMIYLLPGWQESRGASAEAAVAKWVGVPIQEAE